MKVGRRSLLTTALIVLLAALPAVGYIQFRWLSEMSESQATRLAQTLQTASKQVRADLSDELAVISALFTVRTDSGLEAGLEGFAESYRTWSERSRFPGLVAGVRVYQIQDGAVIVRSFDTQDLSFDTMPEPLPADVAGLAEQIAQLVRGSASLPIDSTVRVVSPIGSVESAVLGTTDRGVVLDGIPTTAVAGRPFTADLMGYLVTQIDRSYLATVMLPQLVAEHIPLADAGGDFVAAVVDPDTETILFSSRPTEPSDLFGETRRAIDDQLVLAYRADVVPAEATADSLIAELRVTAPPEIREERAPPDTEPPRGIDRNVVAALRHPILQMWLGRLALEDGRSTLVTGSDHPISIYPVRPALSDSDADEASRRLEVRPSLQLLTWHQAGSIAQGVAQNRNRNIGISAVVLAILAGAIVLLYAMLLRSLRLRDQEREFIASVTHELRTPIAAIYATGENLAHGVVSNDERVIEYGGLLLEEGTRLRTMVEHVLLFAGLNAAKHRPRTEPIDTGELIRRVVAHTPEVDSARLSLDIDDRLPPVQADRVALESLVGNLLSNAFKHNEPGTSVVVSTSQRTNAGSRSCLVLGVTDDGRGIPKSERSQVTEPFFRGAWSSSRQVPGSGLGLSLCTRIAALHHGTLSVTSPTCGGTAVVVTIPYDDRRSSM